MVFKWTPSFTQGRPEPYIIGFDTYDSETNPSIPDDSIDVDIVVNDIMGWLKEPSIVQGGVSSKEVIIPGIPQYTQVAAVLGTTITIEAKAEPPDNTKALFYECIWSLNGVKQKGLPKGAGFNIGRDLTARLRWNIPSDAKVSDTHKFEFRVKDSILGTPKLTKAIQVRLK
jgi:hypothetical protein